jgi:hypothetical protein
VVLKSWALALDEVFDFFDELGGGHVVGFLFAAGAHVDPAGLGFLVAHHEQERHFLKRVLADLGVNLLVASIQLDANSNRTQLCRDAIRVILVPLADRDKHRLHGRQPYGEGSSVMLD